MFNLQTYPGSLQTLPHFLHTTIGSFTIPFCLLGLNFNSIEKQAKLDKLNFQHHISLNILHILYFFFSFVYSEPDDEEDDMFCCMMFVICCVFLQCNYFCFGLDLLLKLRANSVN